MSLLNKEPVKRVEENLKNYNENLNIIKLDTSARTALEAASSLGCNVGAIVKSLLFRAEEKSDLTQLYEETRAQGFGKEVKRRLMIGTYVLSAGYYDAYYLKALKIDPDHIGALEYLGELYYETGRVDKAEDLLERLKSVAGENSEEYLELYEIINS